MVEVVWANSGFKSKLDHQCIMFTRDLMAFMQNGYEIYDSQSPSSSIPDRGRYAPWVWDQIIASSESLQDFYLNKEVVEEYDSVRVADFFINLELFNARYDASELGMLVLWPRRLNRGPDGTISEEIWTNSNLFPITIIQHFNPGTLAGPFHQYCNRRTGDWILDVETGEIRLVEWVYDYKTPNPSASPFDYRPSNYPSPSSILYLESNLQYHPKYLVIGDVSYVALNYPLGMPL